jgi:hypothetical protein
MTPIVSIKAVPCPDPECVDGVILVYNAYSENPLEPEEQTCDICGGKSYLVEESISNN